MKLGLPCYINARSLKMVCYCVSIIKQTNRSICDVILSQFIYNFTTRSERNNHPRLHKSEIKKSTTHQQNYLWWGFIGEVVNIYGGNWLDIENILLGVDINNYWGIN